jgi:hypothetical protein
MARDIQIITNLDKGYQSRQDVTMLPPGYLIPGSKNVLTGVSGRVGVAKGYTLDGQAGNQYSPILFSYDFERQDGEVVNLRAYTDSSTGKGILQWRYVDEDFNVTWKTLYSDLLSGLVRATSYWDSSRMINSILFVDGTPNTVYSWTGAKTAYKSSTNTALPNACTINDGGTGYAANTYVRVTGGTGIIKIVSVSMGGVVTDISTYDPGSGYSISTGVTTYSDPAFPVLGTGLKINIPYVENVIEKDGTTTTLYEDGFSLTGTLNINGTIYTYTGGIPNDKDPSFAGLPVVNKFFGVTPDPTGAGIVLGDLVVQGIKVNSVSLGSTYFLNLISSLNGRIYYGSTESRLVYLSKFNVFDSVSFSTPALVGDGALILLDDNAKAFFPQENNMYISAGNSQWYTVSIDLSNDLQNQSVSTQRLKTGGFQGALSQEFVSKDKNNILFVSQEPVLTTLGRVAGVIETPQSTDISWPIVNDFNSYDFGDGCVFYYKNFILVSIPKHGIIRIYNQTRSDVQYWEAPVEYPVSRFSVIDGELYGHSYQRNETYKLLDGYNFNGKPYEAIAVFSYNNYGTRTNQKVVEGIYSEGYIGQNSTLYSGSIYETSGCAQVTEYPIVGSDTSVVCIPNSFSSLGKTQLGLNPLGGELFSSFPADDNLPPKFRVIKTFPPTSFYEHSLYFRSYAKDFQWEIIAVGSLFTISQTLNNNIMQ